MAAPAGRVPLPRVASDPLPVLERGTPTVALTIDGVRVRVPEGLPLIEAAKLVGVEIPHLCHDQKLEPYGSCRMCLVQIEGRGGFPASCTTKATDGLVVTTRSTALTRLRTNVMDLYLSDHPPDCLTCAANNICPLQDEAADSGIRKISFVGERHESAIDRSNPYFDFDPTKCIVCVKCVRACGEIQGTFALSLSGRGFDTKVIAGDGGPFGGSPCVSCGACVSVCPTGALQEKTIIAAGTPTGSVRTTCSYCGVGCQFDAQTKAGHIINLQPVGQSPVNFGHACVKGRFGWEFVNSPERLTTPLIRGADGQLHHASWEEALDRIEERLNALRAAHGPDALGGISSARGTNEENYLMQKLMRAAVGTNNIDNCARVCHSATVAGMMETFGTGAATNSLSDINLADVLMVVGANVTEAHPVTGSRIRQAVARGARLIVIDPRRIALVDDADVFLQLRPGTNVAVLNGLGHLIVREGWIDKDFIERRTEEYNAYKLTIAKYTPEYVQDISGVPPDALWKAAYLYSHSRASMCLHGLGVSEHKTGSYGVMALANLAMLTGNVGKPGTGINPLRGQNNVQGACDMGALPLTYTTYQKVSDGKVRKRFEEAYGVELPTAPGRKIPEMYEAMLAGQMRALYIVGDDIAQTDPNSAMVEQALRTLDFLVVQDIFLTKTAAMAHVVLPAASYLEKDGTFTNGERRIQRIRKVVDPPGDARADWEIICDVSNRLGYHMHYADPGEVFAEAAALTPLYSGATYARLEGEGLQWPVPNDRHPGTTVMHEKQFPRGKGKFAPHDYEPPGEEPTEAYPFTMITGRGLFQYNCGSMTQRTKLRALEPEDLLEVNPADARRLGIAMDERVALESARGKITIRVLLSDRVAPGQVFTTFHYAETDVNRLLSSSADVLSKCPEYKVSTVNIRRLQP